MINLLIHIKEKVKPFWSIIEWINAGLIKILYHSKIKSALSQSIQQQTIEDYHIRLLTKSDIDSLSILIKNQDPAQLKYFEPHNFDHKSLEKIFRNPSFFRMGAFFDTHLVGYFFLRCFANKKCFVGRLVDKDHRRKGIGEAMNQIMYYTAWDSGFRCFATISKNNELVMKAHAKNDRMEILKELSNEHLLVEFVEKDTSTEQTTQGS